MFDSSQVTVLIPTSPIPRHPNTDLIERTLSSIRFHLPDAPVIIMADGVRPNVEFRRTQYEEYIQRLADTIATMKYGNTCMPVFTEYSQQAQMTKVCLSGLVGTPYVMFCEHDGELVTTENPRDGRQDTLPEDCIIEWGDITDLIASGGSNLVRFYTWEDIYPGHAHLMRGQMIQGKSRFIKTVQYSQWPHIASTTFYRNMLETHTRPGEIKMIELAMYGPVDAAPWEDYRITIYLPEGNGRRFYHRNGRADENGVQDPVDW